MQRLPRLDNSSASLPTSLAPLSPGRRHSQRILGLDIEAEHGASWDSAFDARIFFGASMRWDDETEHRYLPPHASRAAFARWVKPLYAPGVLVVAHNGEYDLGGLNGESIRLGLGSLPPLMLSDTCKHLPKRGNMWSASLENMCHHYGIQGKGSMPRHGWEEAYRGDKHWLEQVRLYNENDVDCVLALRRALIAAGVLRPPQIWSPGR